MFYGRGAGGAPTASAVLGDVVDAASNLAKGAHASDRVDRPAVLRPIDELSSPFYLNLEVQPTATACSPGRRRVRRARGVDPLDGAGGPRRRRRRAPVPPG
jgi:hypothetical protein